MERDAFPESHAQLDESASTVAEHVEPDDPFPVTEYRSIKNP